MFIADRHKELTKERLSNKDFFSLIILRVSSPKKIG